MSQIHVLVSPSNVSPFLKAFHAKVGRKNKKVIKCKTKTAGIKKEKHFLIDSGSLRAEDVTFVSASVDFSSVHFTVQHEIWFVEDVPKGKKA